MKREALPILSQPDQRALDHYEQILRSEEDLTVDTFRNYLSHVRHFAAWCEARSAEGEEQASPFSPAAVTTPTITAYRTYLQHTLPLKPASVNLSLVSLKRYFAWLTKTRQIKQDLARVVKLVEQEVPPPRHLRDREEQALVAIVTEWGNPRDRAIIVFMLHTGLRAREVCMLTSAQIRLGKRSRTIQMLGKRNKYREIPLNATARAVLQVYDLSLQKYVQDATPLFLSERTHTSLTGRGLGYLIKKYAQRANVRDVSPHDLRHRFGYRMAESVPLQRLAQLMGHDSLDTTMIYIQATKSELQKEAEKVAWV